MMDFEAITHNSRRCEEDHKYVKELFQSIPTSKNTTPLKTLKQNAKNDKNPHIHH